MDIKARDKDTKHEIWVEVGSMRSSRTHKHTDIAHAHNTGTHARTAYNMCTVRRRKAACKTRTQTITCVTHAHACHDLAKPTQSMMQIKLQRVKLYAGGTEELIIRCFDAPCHAGGLSLSFKHVRVHCMCLCVLYVCPCVMYHAG